MVDPYLLTAPVLLLGIVFLLRFVGCSFRHGAPSATDVTLMAAPCSGKVNLNWTVTNPPSATGLSYQINRDNNLLNTVSDVASYTDNTAANGTTYSYSVTIFYGGTSYATSNSVSTTPAALPGRPPGSIRDPGNQLSQNLIGLFLMNDGTGQTEGQSADDTNIVDGTMAAHSGSVAPTWELADPSVVFHGGPSLTCYLDAGVDAAFDDMPTSQITIIAKVFLNADVAGGICEKNDSNQG